ncbi:MAG: hypothetical protein GY862_17610 [Gammaproteobacteria bacterium]|nr:hypothetical protein [Gammaproteobacteria bacterium]
MSNNSDYWIDAHHFKEAAWKGGIGILLLCLLVLSVIDTKAKTYEHTEGRLAALAPEAAGDAFLRKSPEGIPAAEWADIVESIRGAEYELSTDGKNYAARNRVQQINAAFDAKGVRISSRNEENIPLKGESGHLASGNPRDLYLTLTGYGYGEDIRPVPAAEAVADGNRMEYRRGNLVEWYVNNREGIEQGFTLQAPPPRALDNAFRPSVGKGAAVNTKISSSLRLELSLDTALTPHLQMDGQAMAFMNSAGQTILHYDKLHVFDAAGQTVPAHFEFFDPDEQPAAAGQKSPAESAIPPDQTSKIHIVVNDSQALYPLIIDPLIATELVNFNVDAKADDLFGFSVSVSEKFFAVGVRDDDDGGISSGSVHIFEKNDTDWIQAAKLTIGETTGAMFGTSVSLSGNILAVGAPRSLSGSIT